MTEKSLDLFSFFYFVYISSLLNHNFSSTNFGVNLDLTKLFEWDRAQTILLCLLPVYSNFGLILGHFLSNLANFMIIVRLKICFGFY